MRRRERDKEELKKKKDFARKREGPCRNYYKNRRMSCLRNQMSL